jgi:hypothetical protein
VSAEERDLAERIARLARLRYPATFRTVLTTGR